MQYETVTRSYQRTSEHHLNSFMLTKVNITDLLEAVLIRFLGKKNIIYLKYFSR